MHRKFSSDSVSERRFFASFCECARMSVGIINFGLIKKALILLCQCNIEWILGTTSSKSRRRQQPAAEITTVKKNCKTHIEWSHIKKYGNRLQCSINVKIQKEIEMVYIKYCNLFIISPASVWQQPKYILYVHEIEVSHPRKNLISKKIEKVKESKRIFIGKADASPKISTTKIWHGRMR